MLYLCLRSPCNGYALKWLIAWAHVCTLVYVWEREVFQKYTLICLSHNFKLLLINYIGATIYSKHIK